MYLCISVSLRACRPTLAGNSRKILTICLLDSWRSWLFAWPSLPVCVGDIVECAGLSPSFPEPSGSAPASERLGGSPHGPESAAFTCAFLPPVQCPCHAGLLLSCKPWWRHSATQGAGPGSGLFPLGAGTAALSGSRSESGSNWGKRVAPLAYPWLTLSALLG